jgi:hypothetical protein
LFTFDVEVGGTVAVRANQDSGVCLIKEQFDGFAQRECLASAVGSCRHHHTPRVIKIKSRVSGDGFLIQKIFFYLYPYVLSWLSKCFAATPFKIKEQKVFGFATQNVDMNLK